MTIAQMKDYFLILQDKYGSPYHTDSEIETFINRATIDEVVALLPVDGGEINVDLNENTRARIAPLYFAVDLNMNGSGVITKADIETAVGSPILRILALGWDDLRPVKPTRYNQWYSFIANVFKVPSATSPRTLEGALEWNFRPIDTLVDINVKGLIYPTGVSISAPTNSVMPDFMHNEIVSRALELAGVGSRDQMLGELKQLNKV